MTIRSHADLSALALNKIPDALNQIVGFFGMVNLIPMRNETFSNSLVREHFTVDGTPKVRRSRGNAEEFAADHGLVAYQCAFCSDWHVGTER